jgi:hypothetical protein
MVTIRGNMKHMTIAAFAISLVLGVFSPALIPTLWHLRHGDHTEQEGKLIPVPQGWYASAELFRAVELIKPSLTVFSHAGSARAYLGALTGPPPDSEEEFFKRFENNYRKSRANMQLRGPFKMGNSGSEAVCMQSLPAQLPGSAFVSCLLFGGTWTAEFMGDQSQVDNFFQVVRGASSAHLSVLTTPSGVHGG